MIKKRTFAVSEGNKRRMGRAQWRNSFRYHGVSCFTGDRLTEASRRQTFTVSCSSCLISAALFHSLPRSHPQSWPQIVVALEKIHVKWRVDRDGRQPVPCSFQPFCLFSAPSLHTVPSLESSTRNLVDFSSFQASDYTINLLFELFCSMYLSFYQRSSLQCCALFFILESFIYIRRFYKIRRDPGIYTTIL